MLELKEIVKVVNEVIETCRGNSRCNLCCPYWDEEKKECKIQMQTNVGYTPDMW